MSAAHPTLQLDNRDSCRLVEHFISLRSAFRRPGTGLVRRLNVERHVTLSLNFAHKHANLLELFQDFGGTGAETHITIEASRIFDFDFGFGLRRGMGEASRDRRNGAERGDLYFSMISRSAMREFADTTVERRHTEQQRCAETASWNAASASEGDHVGEVHPSRSVVLCAASLRQ